MVNIQKWWNYNAEEKLCLKIESKNEGNNTIKKLQHNVSGYKKTNNSFLHKNGLSFPNNSCSINNDSLIIMS